MKQVFGTDIGGVLAEHISFAKDKASVPEISGAFDALRYLNDKIFKGGMYVVSMCGPEMEKLSRDWLDRHSFYERSGVTEESVIYCREHSDKAGIAQELGITHFVDDRLEVLSEFDGGELYLFRPRPEEVRPHAQHLARVSVVHSWKQITESVAG